MSKDMTDIYGRLLTSVREIGQWGTDEGHLDVERLRLTVESRKEEAKKLIDAGMSRRKAAKTLGVSHSTILNDLNGKKVAKNGNKVARVNGQGIKVPDGQLLSDHIHNLMQQGLPAEKIEGIDPRAFRRAREIVTIVEKYVPDLNEEEAARALEALALMNETRQVTGPHKLIEDIARRIWGKKSGWTDGGNKRAPKYVGAITVLMDTCESATEVPIPQLSKDDLELVGQYLGRSLTAINQIKRQLKELYK